VTAVKWRAAAERFLTRVLGHEMESFFFLGDDVQLAGVYAYYE
jgi:hypothetical protein